ncbi:hypothetical protein BDB00DRAFT_876592 [Zychaea mexicana]|uniref:uncharacterized protein n=1 Tax=Zychaea mexicana TaxID=64656 RepID=UPI0022FE5768|nr:uncharacterized protein BDB00DRAFT_876592 [Zychaea mexicana]KAI9489224.1 hypothetical protein BDB00DRAFT_876592 [Zychaea mexicana]
MATSDEETVVAPETSCKNKSKRSVSDLSEDEAEATEDNEFRCSFCPAVLTNKLEWKQHQCRKHLSVVNVTLGNFMTKQSKINFWRYSKNQITERQLMYKCSLSVSSLRQYTSGFKHPRTYATWRATLDGLDNDLLQPATIFTIADVPNIQGYGVSDMSMAKPASLVLQTIAIASRHDLDPIHIAPFLSPIVKSAASVLSSANQKIKTHVEAKLQTLFGNQN